MARGGIFIDGNLGYPLLESHIVAGWHNFSYFFFIARSLSRLDSNVTVWVATQNHTQTRLSVLFVNWCLCEKFSDYLYTPCCYTARQLSFNLGSSLPSQLTFLLEHQSIPERNGRHQSQNCSMSVLEAEKNLNGFRFITMSLYYTRFILSWVEKAMKLWLSDFAELFVLSGCSHILLVVVVFKYFW